MQSTTDSVPVLFILYFLYRLSTRPSHNPQSTTDAVLVLPILCSPLQTQYQSSVFSTVHLRPSTRHTYNLKSTTDPVPVLRILYNINKTTNQSSVYTINYRHSTDYSPVQTNFQALACSTVFYRPSASSLYNQQSSTDPKPVLRIFYSPLQTKFQSSVYSTMHYGISTNTPYTLKSTRDPVLDLCILLSPLKVPVIRILYNM